MTCLTKVSIFSTTVPPDVGGQHCPCPVLVSFFRIFLKIVSGVRLGTAALTGILSLSKFLKILNSRELSKIFDPEFNQRPSENFTFTPGIRILSFQVSEKGIKFLPKLYAYHVTFFLLKLELKIEHSS